MINIITNKYESASGPDKVVQNLIKGLSKLHYPYVINADINSCLRTYIPNRRNALRLLAKAESKVVVGPNLYVLPQDICRKCDFSRSLYVLPSEWNMVLWQELGFDLCPLRVWPTGIDTDSFAPRELSFSNRRILIYHKERNPSELRTIESVVTRLHLEYTILYYGKYKQKDYIQALQNTSFVLWHGRHESQGLALQEALAMNVPVLVCDVASVFDQYQVGYRYVWPELCRNMPATAAPYFDESCGLKIRDLDELEEAIDHMFSKLDQFAARDYVLGNLSLAGQAKKMIELYEYWGMGYERGFSERLLNTKKYKEPLLYQIKSFGRNVPRKIPK
jgi:hypothetical protein